MVSIDNLSPGYDMFLVRSGSMDVRRRNLELVSNLTEAGYSVIVVTSNSPSNILIRQYEDAGIDMQDVTIIDMVTAYSIGKRQEDHDSIHFVDRPGDLTKAGILISECINKNQGEKFAFVFDTINTMLIYSSMISVTRFIHFVINKLRLRDGRGFFLIVEKGVDNELLTDFEMLVDVSVPRDEPITLVKSGIEESIGVPEEDEA